MMFAAVSERMRKMDSRTSGAFARSSIRTKRRAATAESANVPIVWADVQPFSCAWTIA